MIKGTQGYFCYHRFYNEQLNHWVPITLDDEHIELLKTNPNTQFRMKVLTEGHKYVAANFENSENGQTIQFIEKIPNPEGSNGELITVNDGTTNEELLEILINRMQYLQGKFPCKENACCITHLEEGLMWLEKRTNDRKKRQVEGKNIA